MTNTNNTTAIETVKTLNHGDVYPGMRVRVVNDSAVYTVKHVRQTSIILKDRNGGMFAVQAIEIQEAR
jgi:hypothetical protein